MRFIGRIDELKKLNKVITKEAMTFSLIYGRRRVGKSELVKQAIKECGAACIYYECKQVAMASNVKSLGEVVSETMGLPPLGFTEIEDLLRYLFNLSKERKLVLVLDEYPYLRESVKGMDSILQSLIDEYRETSKLSLIILGSYVDVMKSLAEHANPLFGRIDLTIDLKPMDYYDAAQFYPGYSAEDKVRIYSVFGGIPYYNRLIDDSLSVKENLIELIASCGARLENEVSMYLSAEISKIANANEVFEALSRGYTRYGDILSQSHVSSGPTLVDVLEKLMRMDVVEKTMPINGGGRNKTGYRISDNLSLFYYRYIFKYFSQLQIMDPETFYDRYIAKDFDEQYVPKQFETICRQYLIRENKTGRMCPTFDKIGKYYYDKPKEHINGEFDIVTEDENGYIFYEVKFRKNSITDAIIETEISQVEETGLNCYQYAFISRSGFDCTPRKDTRLISLEELFEDRN